MKRRNLIKGIGAFGIASLLPFKYNNGCSLKLSFSENVLSKNSRVSLTPFNVLIHEAMESSIVSIHAFRSFSHFVV